MEARIVELELKLMEQESTLEALNTTVLAQDKLLAALRAEVDLLKKRIQEPGVVEATRDERPPHY